MAGFLVDAISGRQPDKNYSVIYYLMVAALLPNIFVSTCLEVSAIEHPCETQNIARNTNIQMFI